MIKLKHSLIGLLIGGFILIGGSFVNGIGAYTTVGVSNSPSAVNGNYDITFLKGGGLLSNYIGQGKGILALDNEVLFWWLPDGLPYFYGVGRNKIQGYFPKFYYCSSMSSGGSYQEPTNCTENYIDESNTPLLRNFFTTVKAGDVVYYNLINDGGAGRWWYGFQICWNSSEIGKSICFKTMSNYNRPCVDEGGGCLINSRGYTNLTFANLPYSEIGYAPGQAGYGGNYDNTNNNTTNVTLGTCPTIRQILQNNYTSNYNTGLCYNNTTYFNGTSFETITKDDIFTIFNDNYENYTNRISIYRNNCTNANTTQACQNAFSGQYKKYSIIANAQQSNVDEKKLWNYCNLALNYDPNTTTCVGSGLIKEQPTQEEILNDILNINTGVPIPGNATTTQDNNVFNSLCDPNNPQNCYGSGNVRDIFGSMQRIYGKITGLFIERSGVDGIIPDYILRITFLTILFTIIFKK